MTRTYDLEEICFRCIVELMLLGSFPCLLFFRSQLRADFGRFLPIMTTWLRNRLYGTLHLRRPRTAQGNGENISLEKLWQKSVSVLTIGSIFVE